MLEHLPDDVREWMYLSNIDGFSEVDPKVISLKYFRHTLANVEDSGESIPM